MARRRFVVFWMDEDDNEILRFKCYFKDDQPVNDKFNDNMPYFDPACTISLDDVGLSTPHDVHGAGYERGYRFLK